MSSIKDTVKKQIEVQTALDADRAEQRTDAVVHQAAETMVTELWADTLVRPALEAARREIEAATREAGKPTNTKLSDRSGKPGHWLPALVLTIHSTPPHPSTTLTVTWNNLTACATISAVFGPDDTHDYAKDEEITHLPRGVLDSIFKTFSSRAFAPR
jgi:nucleoside-diphosphate-sugar epimerase